MTCDSLLMRNVQNLNCGWSTRPRLQFSSALSSVALLLHHFHRLMQRSEGGFVRLPSDYRCLKELVLNASRVKPFAILIFQCLYLVVWELLSCLPLILVSSVLNLWCCSSIRDDSFDSKSCLFMHSLTRTANGDHHLSFQLLRCFVFTAHDLSKARAHFSCIPFYFLPCCH